MFLNADELRDLAALRSEIEAQQSINQALRLELEMQQSRADHWRQLAEYAYARSSEGLMTRGNRAARDNALSDINKRLGGAIR